MTSQRLDALEARLQETLGDRIETISSACGELTIEVGRENLLDVCRELRDGDGLRFEMLIDLCGVDYLDYGRTEWMTGSATGSGFSRGVNRHPGDVSEPAADGRRFAVVYHLLSISLNMRLRLRTFAADSEPPMLDSVVGIWASANWFEREAFDLFGILFVGHPDLRRLLTDYGFIGHPFRRDFPLIGNVEVRYDPEKGRVVYQPVSIEPRTLVARVIREDTGREQGETGGHG
ncbi:MAG: NADH-quinone oxidoreductase subunit C [Gammaproteobacteria bacterium]|jgi:NADH-quinone oxidoreductase subunit C